MMDVATDSHLQCPSQCLEDAFYLMMLIVSFCSYIEIHACTVTEAFEEVEEHLCGHVSYLLAMELRLPYQPGATTEIKGYFAETVVHGQTETVTLYTSFAA